jgi:uncharacterized membrane protein
VIYIINKKLILILILILSFWLGGIVIAPVLAASAIYWQKHIARILYFLYQPVCHQFPQRSFYINSFPFTVCVRCFAVYLCGLVLAVYYLFRHSIKMLKLSSYVIIAIFPLLDFILEKLNLYHNLIFLRFITGGMLGFILFHFLIIGISEVRKE